MNRRRAFILLEVLVALAILGVAVSMVLRSFTSSIKAVQYSEQATQAALLAQSLIDDFELEEPPEGYSEGDFGSQHPRYRYELDYEPEAIDYRGVSRRDSVGRLAELKNLRLRVYYQAADGAQRRRLLEVHTALLGAERFSAQARLMKEIGFE